MNIFFLQQNIIFLLLCLDYTSIVFLLGFTGLLINRRNILLMLLSLELTFLASSLNFIISGSILNLVLGSIYGILVILIVVADTAIGVRPLIIPMDMEPWGKPSVIWLICCKPNDLSDFERIGECSMSLKGYKNPRGKFNNG